MTPILVEFDHLAGAAVHYARAPVAPYGTIGRGPRRVRLEAKFRSQLETALEALWAVHPLGRAEVIVSGGCYVEKAGRHGEGRAIDIDAIWWKGGRRLVTLEAVKNAREYLGVEAVLRQHFGTVLDWWFGHGHEDHWHVDNGQAQGWTGRPPTFHAETLFVQSALRYVHGCTDRRQQPLDVDGVFGPDTEAALAHLYGGLYMNLMAPGTWNGFLKATATAAFAVAP